VLGSSGAWPIPRLGCDCPQCTSTDPRDQRLRPSLLVDRTTLVDAGPDCYHQLRRAEAVPAEVLMTHAHYDHSLGLHTLAKLGRLPLHATRECEHDLRQIFPRLDFRILQMTPGVKVELEGGAAAQPFDVAHSENSRTVGFRFTSPDGGTLVYVPDMVAEPESKLARGADVLMLDGSTRDRRQGGHMPMSETLGLLKRLKANRVIFTHIGHRAGTHAELESWLDGRAEAAYDGMVIDL
jgi:phosphoribosyl 1,2-cyclic phosphate phosphodiesterase